MDKTQLFKIFSKPFSNSDWLKVLHNVFGAKQLLSQPREILLPSNDKANAAFELGNFTTSDDRIIGLYRIEINPDVWLERNKVGLRELLRNIYKYDVDGAIIVFDQGKKWRLSFVSEIKVLNDEGEVIEQATEPKRYTYLLGEDEKVKTPSERLNKLAGKTLALNDILEAFSVEALNEEFYKIVAEYFYQLIGGEIGKGKKGKDYGDGILQLPSVPKENHQVYQEFTVRLIGRTVFCWFLKMKKNDNKKSLLPEKLLSSKAVKDNTGYYHFVLERLFFQTLNTRMSERADNLPEGCEQIPFLNGGLFEPSSNDYYRANRHTGLSENLNTLTIEDKWFFNFFQELEKYNFTIDENSVADVEVSVDPEMLGRIFENLLAEIDPDSGETARKATGSFYTPREIVDYMATESLVQYLHNKTGINSDQLRPVFKMTEQKQPTFSDSELEDILDALEKVKILDPACGSGAFPMGVLQKIVMALQKLDLEAKWWKKRQIKRITNPIIKKALREKLDASSVEYARKIGVIQNSLYGVDIQPIAAEISKLRCFLTLIVDENIDDTKKNRGIEPLPNLEFKFVTADALMKLPEQKEQRTMFDNFEEMEQLKELREEYLQSSGEEKEEIKEQFIKVQTKMFKNEMHLFSDTKRAYKLSSWNPFSHDKADWFDPKWMFGVDSFDVVIGNPPYGTSVKGSYRSTVTESLGKVPDYEIYYYFINRANQLTEDSGILSYIIPNTYLFNTNAKYYRTKLLSEWNLKEILDCTNFPIFKNAVVRNTINTWQKGKTNSIGYRNTKGKSTFKKLLQTQSELISINNVLKFNTNWGLAFSLDNVTFNAINKIRKLSNKLSSYFPEISQGLIAYDKYRGQTEEIIKSRVFHYSEKVKDDLKLWLKGADVTRYSVKWNKKLYIDYCDGIANPRSPKFFKGSRILIREITNPSIYAGYTEDELYNDPSIIIVKSNNDYSIKSLLAILNSKLASFFHFNSSPKATKGAFPKILVQDIKKFPLVFQFSQLSLDVLADYILFLNIKIDKINPHVPNSHLVLLFEEVIDAMVMELYFEEDFKNAGIEFIKYAERDFKAIDHLKSEQEKIEVIHQSYQTLRQKENEIRNNLKLMDIKLADIVMLIKTAK